MNDEDDEVGRLAQVFIRHDIEATYIIENNEENDVKYLEYSLTVLDSELTSVDTVKRVYRRLRSSASGGLGEGYTGSAVSGVSMTSWNHSTSPSLNATR